MEPNRVREDEEEGQEREESLFNEYQKERKANNGGKMLLMFLVLIILGFVVWAVWRYAFTKKESTENLTSTEGVVPVKDSALKADSATLANEKSALSSVSDTVSFYIVVSQYHTFYSADRKFQQLKSHNRNVILYTNDSTIYKIAEPFNLPLSDTTQILDSLKQYYAKVFVEIK